MREFPTTAAPKPGSEQSLDNLNCYSDKLAPVLEKKEEMEKKNLLLHQLVWQIVCFCCSHSHEPTGDTAESRAGCSFISIQPHLVPFGHPPRHNQLDHPALVPLGGHGLAQRLHGILVGFSQQRLSVDSDQLVIDPKPPVLLQEERSVGRVFRAKLFALQGSGNKVALYFGSFIVLRMI